MDWIEKIRKIADEVAGKDYDSDELYAREFLKMVQREITKEMKPDVVKKVSGIVGRPRLVAYKRLDGSYPDAWGKKTNMDSVVVAVANIGGIAEDGTQIWEFPISEEEAKQKTYRFMAISPEEHEVVVREVDKYINTDTEDLRDTPLAFALVPLGMRNDSPSQKWNEVAERMRERETERMIDDEWKSLNEKLQLFGKENMEHFLTVVMNRTVNLEGVKFEKNTPEKVKKGEPTVKATLPLCVKGNCRDVVIDASNLLYALENYATRWKEVDKFVDDANKLLNAVFDGGTLITIENEKNGKKFEIPLRGNTIEVPKNLAGLVIGKGGKRIKDISKLVERRLKVKEVTPYDLGEGHYTIRIAGKCHDELGDTVRGVLRWAFDVMKDAGIDEDEKMKFYLRRIAEELGLSINHEGGLSVNHEEEGEMEI